jgi:N-dimethylarginine dimethylaminohydrolase
MKTFLMCPPDFFNVAYEINPHMVGNINYVDVVEAKEQWENLYDAVAEHATVVILDPIEGLPDMVFVANAAVVNPETGVALISSFKHKERQGETEVYAKFFDENDWETYVSEVPFEGAGDCLVDRYGEYWLGYGQRSAKEAIFEIEGRVLEDYLHTVRLVDPRWYHLDTCFCPLDTGYYLAAQSAFTKKSWEYIVQTIGSKLIVVDDEDAMKFACNAVSIGHTVIMPKCSDYLVERLAVTGHNVVQLNMSEFLKSGGACKCLVLELGHE